MDRRAFRAEFDRMADVNGLYPPKSERMIDTVFQAEPEADFLNIFRGFNRGDYLLVTGGATYSLTTGLFGVRLNWLVSHDDLDGAVHHARGQSMGHTVDQIVVPHSGGVARFQVGFTDRRDPTAREIAKHNCETAAAQINDAAAESPSPTLGQNGLAFDPQGPEKAASEAKAAYRATEFVKAFERSVVAVDRLHDFYVFEGFRNRQPSPADAWIVDGLTSALGAARHVNPVADVREGVRTATHRLRTVASAIERAGGDPTLYRGALDALARYAPDVDVSDIFWT